MAVAAILNNKKGFTIVELLISMLILSIILIALTHSLAVYMQYNVINTLRNEAIKIAQGCAEKIRTGQSCSNSITVNFRKFTVRFNITAPNPVTFSSGTNDVLINVNYRYGKKTYSYTLRTVIYKE